MLMPFHIHSNSSCDYLEKEFLELTYMSKTELIKDYCEARSISNLNDQYSAKFSELRDFNEAKKLSNFALACTKVSSKIFRVLRKDHGIETVIDIPCPKKETINQNSPIETKPELKGNIENLKKNIDQGIFKFRSGIISFNQLEDTVIDLITDGVQGGYLSPREAEEYMKLLEIEKL